MYRFLSQNGLNNDFCECHDKWEQDSLVPAGNVTHFGGFRSRQGFILLKSCTKYPGFQSFGSLEALISYGGGFWDVSPAHPGEQWDVMLHPHPRADLGRDCHYPINVIGEGRKKKKEGFVTRNGQE